MVGLLKSGGAAQSRCFGWLGGCASASLLGPLPHLYAPVEILSSTRQWSPSRRSATGDRCEDLRLATHARRTDECTRGASSDEF
jgi:hypothetical protein